MVVCCGSVCSVAAASERAVAVAAAAGRLLDELLMGTLYGIAWHGVARKWHASGRRDDMFDDMFNVSVCV